MEKANVKKPKKGAGSIPNKALHSRVSYLYQAAKFLSSQQNAPVQFQTATSSANSENAQIIEKAIAPGFEISTELQPVSRQLVSDLRSVSLKVQIRMSPAMKHSICKNCDTILVDSSTCTTSIENKSKGGKKPWADVLVQKCVTCGYERRVPVGAERQLRRPQRDLKIVEVAPGSKSGR